MLLGKNRYDSIQSKSNMAFIKNVINVTKRIKRAKRVLTAFLDSAHTNSPVPIFSCIFKKIRKIGGNFKNAIFSFSRILQEPHKIMSF